MNTINVFLEASGQIADLQKDFPLYVGQYQNVKIDIFIPSEIMADSFIYQSKTTNNAIISDNSAYTAVKIAMSYIKRTGTIAQSTNYYVQFLNTQTINNIKYYVYERYLPTTFTLFSGTGEQSPKLTINVVNELSTTTTSNGTTTTNVSLLSRITSQTCALEVLPSNDLTSDPTTDPSELEILSGSVNSLLALMPTKSDRDATVLKYDVADFSSTGTPPLDINYTKDGFKTYGVLFKNETFSVPTIQGDTSNQTGSIIVIAFRQSGTTGYQDEMFFNANGINIRTITFNLSATPYEVTNVGEWVAYNTEYMQGLINEHNTSSTAHQDIRNLIMNNTTNISYLQTNKVNKGEGYRNETTGTFDNGVIFNILDSGNDTITLKKYNHDRPTETTNNDNTNSIVLSNSSITLTAQNDTNGTTTTNTIIITSTSFNLNGDPIVSKTYIDNADNLLRNEIENLGALTYKGSVATYGDLPTNAKTGDMYNVVAPYGEYSANSNYAWNGTEWDNLGGQVDLSAYSTTTQMNSAIASAVETHNTSSTAHTDIRNEILDNIGKEQVIDITATLNTVTGEISGDIPTTFNLVDNTSFFIDLHLPLTTLTGDLSDDYLLKLNYNSASVNTLCVAQTDTTKNSSVRDLCMQQQYDQTTGYRWLLYVHYRNINSTQWVYIVNVSRETNGAMTGTSLHNAIANNSLKTGTVIMCTQDYNANGIIYNQGHSYLITGSWVSGELILDTVDITVLTQIVQELNPTLTDTNKVYSVKASNDILGGLSTLQQEYNDIMNGAYPVGKAYQDSLGNVIAETYVPKTKIIDTINTTLTNTDETYSVNALNPKIVEVEQNNTDIGSIINGAITVGKSTKATQDQNGNIINETYATKTELSETAPLNVASVSSTAPYSANYTNNNFASISIGNQYYLTKSADTTGTFSLTKSNVADTNYLTTTTTNTTLDFTSATKLTLTLPLANSTLNPNELLTITLATAFNRNNNTEYGVQVFNGSTQIASNQAFGYLSQQGNASYSVVSLITLPIRLDLLTAPTEINGNLVIYIYKAQKKADSLITRYYTGALVNGANRYSYLDYSLNPITSTDFTKTEEFTISTTEWSSLTPALSDSPYNYQATITAVNNITNASIGTIVDDLNLYSVYAFAVGSVSGQTITIWSVGQPSYNVAITIKESY
jgi:hypothetical protein